MPDAKVPPPPLDVMQTIKDGLNLPFRRPILFAPFLFLIAVMALAFVSLLASILASVVAGGSLTAGLLKAYFMTIVVTLAIMAVAGSIAAEATVELTARAELGRTTSLGDACMHVLSRFPQTIGAYAVASIGIALGMALLIIPGLIVAFRLQMVGVAVLLGGGGVRDALAASWRLTGEHWQQFMTLSLGVGVGLIVFTLFLGSIPIIGWLAAGWLSFSWVVIVLTLAYLRTGGPVTLDR